MKKSIAMKSIIMITLAIVTLMVGCKKPVEQSSVSIDDFKEKATIIGKLTFDEGQTLEGSSYVSTIKPAANVKVTAVIASSEFSTKGSNLGNLTYTTKTDEEGNYELSFPVTTQGVNVRVKVANFTGQYKRIVDVQNGQAVYDYEEVVYRLDDMEYFLEPDDVEVADGLFECIGRENETETATIVGLLTYDEGQGFDGTNYTRLIKPAANVNVTATIAKSEYPETAEEEGYLTFTTRTNSEGSYELVVPVATKGVSVNIKVSSFMGQYHRIIDVKDGEPVYENDDVVYSFNDTTVSLKPNDIEVLDGSFESEARENADEFIYTSQYKVIVGQAAYSKSKNADDEDIVSKEYEEAVGVDVIIKVTYEEEVFTYVASTNDEGVATFNLPTNSLNWDPEIEVTANPFTVEKFKYYTIEDVKDEDDQPTGEKKAVLHNLNGYFEQVSGYEDNPEFSSIEGMPTPEHRVKMKFVALDEEDYGQGKEDWSNIEIEF